MISFSNPLPLIIEKEASKVVVKSPHSDRPLLPPLPAFNELLECLYQEVDADMARHNSVQERNATLEASSDSLMADANVIEASINAHIDVEEPQLTLHCL